MDICDRLFVQGIKPASWERVLERARPSIELACKIIEADKRGYIPRLELVFAAFEYTPLHAVLVVLWGIDPYPNDPTGLAFSCDIRVPKSLEVIYAELKRSIPGFVIPKHGNLTSWCEQGVLLLNSSLTTAPGVSDAHPGIWTGLAKHVTEAISDVNSHVVHVGIGVAAQKEAAKVLPPDFKVLKIPHPSPRNARGGFVGSDCFLKINIALTNAGKKPINWHLPMDPLPPLVDFSL